MTLAEYRLEDLARLSGVSARNIRAYRERGLLDSPRRQGRAALYDDYHLAQLQTINRLLGRGFTSAHIAEFFEAMRTGQNLAEFLGLQQAILRPQVEPSAELPVAVEPDSDEALRLIDLGMAHRVGATLVLTDATVSAIVARSPDPLGALRLVLAVLDATTENLDALVDDLIAVLQQATVDFYRPDDAAVRGRIVELGTLVIDFSELSRGVIAGRLQHALQQRLVAAVSEFNAGLMTSGEWERGAKN